MFKGGYGFRKTPTTAQVLTEVPKAKEEKTVLVEEVKEDIPETIEEPVVEPVEEETKVEEVVEEVPKKKSTRKKKAE